MPPRTRAASAATRCAVCASRASLWRSRRRRAPAAAARNTANLPGSASRRSSGCLLLRGVPILGSEQVVGPLLIAGHVVGVVGGRVFRRRIGADAGRYRGYRPVDMAVAEKDEGVTLAARAVD